MAPIKPCAQKGMVVAMTPETGSQTSIHNNASLRTSFMMV
jgi:hypothetical protein